MKSIKNKAKKGEEMPKGSNAKPEHKGFQIVHKKAPKAPKPTQVASVVSKEKPLEDGAEIALKGKVDSHHYDSLLAKAKSKSKYPILTKEDYLKALEKYKVPSDVAKKAASILAKNPPLLVAASGKMASGKDIIISEVLKHLNTSSEYKRLSYAASIKDETQEILNILRSNTRAGSVKALVALGANKEQANKVIELAYEEANNSPELTSHDRTLWIRLTLQYWGTEVRKSKEENYWINKAVNRAAEYIVDGSSILVTDARFPEEVKALQEIGFMVFRLNVTPEVQATRLMARDGLVPDEKALTHSTETALDSYDGFNLVLDNNDPTVDAVVNKIIKFYKSRIKASVG